MTENEFQSKLDELLDKIQSLPDADRPKLDALATETRERHERMRKTVGELQDSLDHLRLSVKYLVFDLEATRRENRYLRNLMEAGQHREDSEGAD